MMDVEPIPVIRGIYLKRVTQVLRDCPGNYAARLAEFNLPTRQLEEPDCYLPRAATLSFAHWASACARCLA